MGIDRRQFVAIGLFAASGCARQLRQRSRQPAACAAPTPEDEVGPFLPLRYSGDADLTRVAGRRERAQGQTIRVRGRVVDDRCRPVPGARIEVWQANTFGRYTDDRDKSGRPLDPGFQGSALLVVDAGARYSILTVKPSSYTAPSGNFRTPHIHFRISGAGCHDDIVQMYFAGEALNAADENLSLLSEAERRRVIVTPSGRDGGAAIHAFDIVLRRVDPVAARRLEQYAGRYLLDGQRGPIPVTLSVVDGKLYADSPPLPRVELRPLSATRFRLKAFEVEIEFDRDGFTVFEGTTRHRARRLP